MSAEAKGMQINNHVAEETSEGYIKALSAEYSASYDINSPFSVSKESYIPASVLKARMDALNSKWQFDKRYWNEIAKRQLHDYFEFLENCSEEQRSFLFSHSVNNQVYNSTQDVQKDYSYDYELSDKFLAELTAYNLIPIIIRRIHKSINRTSTINIYISK